MWFFILFLFFNPFPDETFVKLVPSPVPTELKSVGIFKIRVHYLFLFKRYKRLKFLDCLAMHVEFLHDLFVSFLLNVLKIPF